jgi:hypothetical protein
VAPEELADIRIGDLAFKHFILHTSLFKPVGNNSYLQVTGLPICDLYAGSQKRMGLIKRKRRRQDGGDQKKRKASDVVDTDVRPRKIATG